jgi:hypothetical protein
MISKASLHTIKTVSHKSSVTNLNPAALVDSEQLKDFAIKAWLRKLSKK